MLKRLSTLIELRNATASRNVSKMNVPMTQPDDSSVGYRRVLVIPFWYVNLFKWIWHCLSMMVSIEMSTTHVNRRVANGGYVDLMCGALNCPKSSFFFLITFLKWFDFSLVWLFQFPKRTENAVFFIVLQIDESDRWRNSKTLLEEFQKT